MEFPKQKLNDLPTEPGVYQFKNKDGEVIYVGKAKNLKSRVNQYFTGHDNRPQLPFLMAEAADVSYTVVTTELESLFLENTLIKKFMPKYNIQLRDDKNYAFITIDYSCEIPKIDYARKFDHTNKLIKYFGPYSAVHKIRRTLYTIRQIFPYCAHDRVSTRPCFYYYLHRCPGVCIGKVGLEDYKKELDNICLFLNGRSGDIQARLKREMQQASHEHHFETAARLRDQVRALELVNERQNVIFNKPVSWDIISLHCSDGYASVNLFKIREGKMLDKENFVYDLGNMPAPSTATILQTFVEQYYLETNSVPRSVYLAHIVEDMATLEKIFQERATRTVEISVPQRGKPKELVELGVTNAEEHLRNWLINQASHLDKVQGALHDLQELLHLEAIPSRIECYDISNIQGTNPVGSMVVLKDGLPAKSEYRKFKINVKQTPDDFAMMKEMLSRRLSRMGNISDSANQLVSPSEETSKTGSQSRQKEAWARPDLIVIDGGKGQLGVAVEILKEKNLTIPIIGLAKRIEEIFFPENPEPLILAHTHPALQMLQRLRDEAHRFGITFHRKLRSKQAIKSALDDIPGIGPKTKKILKQKFGTVSKIRQASMEELTLVVGERIARLIQQVL